MSATAKQVKTRTQLILTQTVDNLIGVTHISKPGNYGIVEVKPPSYPVDNRDYDTNPDGAFCLQFRDSIIWRTGIMIIMDGDFIVVAPGPFRTSWHRHHLDTTINQK
jgi:hypothetical protein